MLGLIIIQKNISLRGTKKTFLLCIFYLFSILDNHPLLCRLVNVGLVAVVQAPEVEAHAHAPLVVLYPEVADTGAALGGRESLEELAAVRRMGRGVKVVRHDGVKGAANASIGYRATSLPADFKAPYGGLLLLLDCPIQAELTAAVNGLANNFREGVELLALLHARAAAAQEKANRDLR